MLVLLLANNTDKEERRMSTTMDQIHHIRDLFYVQGKNISEIASETGFNWKTVKKYVDMDDFNNPLPTPKEKVVHIQSLIRTSLSLTVGSLQTKQPHANSGTRQRVYTAGSKKRLSALTPVTASSQRMWQKRKPN